MSRPVQENSLVVCAEDLSLLVPDSRTTKQICDAATWQCSNGEDYSPLAGSVSCCHSFLPIAPATPTVTGAAAAAATSKSTKSHCVELGSGSRSSGSGSSSSSSSSNDISSSSSNSSISKSQEPEPFSPATIILLLPDGGAHILTEPVTVGALLQGFPPGTALVSVTSCCGTLPPEEMLRLGSTYHVVCPSGNYHVQRVPRPCTASNHTTSHCTASHRTASHYTASHCTASACSNLRERIDPISGTTASRPDAAFGKSISLPREVLEATEVNLWREEEQQLRYGCPSSPLLAEGGDYDGDVAAASSDGGDDFDSKQQDCDLPWGISGDCCSTGPSGLVFERFQNSQESLARSVAAECWTAEDVSTEEDDEDEEEEKAMAAKSPAWGPEAWGADSSFTRSSSSGGAGDRTSCALIGHVSSAAEAADVAAGAAARVRAMALQAANELVESYRFPGSFTALSRPPTAPCALLGPGNALDAPMGIVLGRVNVETPRFAVEAKTDAFEIRRYPPQMVAEVTYDGDHQSGINTAFSALAGYIGALSAPQNRAALAHSDSTGEGGEKIAMTAPVLTHAGGERGGGDGGGDVGEKSSAAGEKTAMTAPVLTHVGGGEGGGDGGGGGDGAGRHTVSGEKIAMTAPVLTHSGAGEGGGGDVGGESSAAGEKIAMTAPVVTAPTAPGKTTMQFLLPASLTPSNTPIPTNPAVSIHQLPPRLLGAVTFSGLTTQSVLQHKSQELRSALEAAGYKLCGDYVVGRYNPPFTLPFMRTNEILYPVEG
ncbi:unnamed protein product [Closterium sp. NIES-53]